MRIRNKKGVLITQNTFFVGLLGLEPRKTGPESVVLPLHHSPNLYLRYPLHEDFRFCKMLGYSDSNQEKQDQNLLCYHYTIAQNQRTIVIFLF